ncbi:MAG: rhodanese-like domain-containing protein [Gammaproteobacteria bacterium]|nr:rhodanese-like domain-containing protein [Gammaproteobacteria bacterium]MBU1724595.1 rhodanese-like domain-containing protein [Gammaproteobacteria bacterium]MBU2005315.1 rhodanese-like domain-containing protein [Gammaproteobacteria bacterium]
MKFTQLIGIAALAASLSLSTTAFAEGEAKPVGITADVMSVTVKHNGADVEIKRDQDNNATIVADFAKTSRPCPPFCIQPDTIAEGVQTIAENGMLDYLQKQSGGDASILVVDSRTPDWVEKGTIPGATNVPWEGLAPDKGATTDGIIKIMTEQFGVKLADGADALAVDEAVAAGGDAVGKVFDYSGAKTLVMFCNGMWCGQSPTNIKQLLKFGYPADKIKWYRGGMQDWSILGLTTAKPAAAAPAADAKPAEGDKK